MSSRRVRALFGSVAVAVLAAGSLAWTPASASGSAGTVFLRTVPVMAGVHLRVGSTSVTTGSDGTAQVAVADLNGVAGTVALTSSSWGSRHHVSLAMVTPSAHSAPHESHLTLGIDVSSWVVIHLSRGTTSVAPATVQRVRLHSVTGTTLDIDPRRSSPVLLESRKVRLVGGVPTAQVVTWSVDSLRAAPGVSVTTDHGRFDPFSSGAWPLTLRPVHGTVVLDTVPVTPGVTFLVDGSSVTTDAHGHALAMVSDLNGVENRITLDSSSAYRSTVELLRISRQRAAAPFQRHVVAALAVSRPVSLRFTDPAGGVVSAARVGGVQLVGGGGTIDVPAAQVQNPVSLLSIRARLVNGTWRPQQVTYAVSQVTVEGAEAVFAGQQHFNPNAEAEWPISLSVFDVSVTVRDVLFGSLVSSMADVTRPDGVVVATQLAGNGPTTLHSLVRGEYTLVTRAAVVGGKAVVRVSKSSAVELRVVTWIDVIVLVGLVLVLCASVLWLGRAWARRRPKGSGG